MSMTLEYKYAIIDETGWCHNVVTATRRIDNPYYIPIESVNFDYLDKYYINGSWYEDADGTIPWSPAE